MKIYPSDQPIVLTLVDKRKATQSISPAERMDEQYRWGIPFLELFRDINESVSFSFDNGDIYVHICDDTIPHGKDFNEETYVHYNQTMDLQVKVLQRLLLLRRLEEERLIVWINSGKRSANFNFEDKFFYLINEEDKKLVREKFNYDAVATEELVELVKRRFKSQDDIRHLWSSIATWSGIGVALLIGIISFFRG